jgi:fumarate reductase subunit C
VSYRSDTTLWILQRASAAVLALCVVVHLFTIVYAVRGGLTGAEILGRTHGNWGVGAFYVVFVVACAIHAPIGVMNIAAELPGLRRIGALVVAPLFATAILVLGLRAVVAVFA